MFRTLTAATALRAWNAIFGGADKRAGPVNQVRIPGGAGAAPRCASFGVDPQALAMLGHELRTPLAALMGYTEMLAGAENLTDAQRRAWSASAHAAASHLNALVASVLEEGLQGLGAPSSLRETVDAGALAAGCCDFMRPDASARGVRLCGPDPGDILDLNCDQRAVRQILLNLLSNAIKFTPPGGEVSVRTGREGAMVVLVVSDTGIGMTESRARQAASPEGAGSAGLGLGLCLVHSLASLHGGQVSISPGARSGTVARVLLPARASAPPNETSAGSTCASHLMVPCLA